MTVLRVHNFQVKSLRLNPWHDFLSWPTNFRVGPEYEYECREWWTDLIVWHDQRTAVWHLGRHTIPWQKVSNVRIFCVCPTMRSLMFLLQPWWHFLDPPPWQHAGTWTMIVWGQTSHVASVLTKNLWHYDHPIWHDDHRERQKDQIVWWNHHSDSHVARKNCKLCDGILKKINNDPVIL